MTDLLKKFFFSTRLMAVLFIVFAIAMAFGTFIESWYSTETARIWIYNSKWFEAIMLFFVINFVGNMFRYKLFRKEKWAVLLLHVSWILIIVGAFVTRYISYEGVMPIREGSSENVFYSEKTYLTAMVDGDVNGEPQRRKLEDEIMVTPEAIKSSLPWKSDFKGQPFTISYVGFIRGAKEGLISDPNGKEYLKIVEAGDGQRHEHFLENGTVGNFHNILFALNKKTEGAINIYATDSTYMVESPFEGSFMRMADQLQGKLIKDTLQTLQLRSLYSMAGMQFVIPEPITKGSYGIIALPENEITKASQDALILDITANGETLRKKFLGGKGSSHFTDKIKVGGLEFSLAYGSKVHELPFHIKLNDFIAEKYPGTEKGYSSFMSRVTVEDERPFDYDIYMNHVLDIGGYRFFQSGFDPDEKGTILSVNHDFWGSGITYIGYFMLYAGLMAIMFFGKTRIKSLEKSLANLKKKKASMAALLALGWVLQTTAQEPDHEHSAMPSTQQVDSVLQSTVVSQEHADKFGQLVIQDEGGRMKPINTFASELLRKLSFKDKYKNLDPDQVFLSMMLNPAVWFSAEFLALDKKGQNDSIRKIIGIPEDQEYAKMTDFFNREGEYKLAPYLENAYATNTPNQFQKDFKDTDLRLGLLNQALSGSIVRIFPLLHDENNKWISATDYREGKYQIQDSLYANFVKNAIPYYLMTVTKAVHTGDYSEADKLLAAFEQNQKNNGSEVLPSKNKVKAEIIYNRLDIFNTLYKYYFLVGLLMFLVLIFRIFKDREIWKVATFFFKGTIIILFLWHTAGMALRWYVSGHAPWSDAYESIVYVSWATMAVGLALSRKSEMTMAATTFVASILLIVAHWSWVDPAIANLQPVLDSYWLMIHVAVIVASYGPFAVAMMLGTVSMILIILTNQKNKKRMEINLTELTIINELAISAGLIMLTIGNFLGGMWANESWGRYWGWDPKETWALISIMVYAFVLHIRLVPGLRNKWIFNFLSIAAFSSIMMTYFGVNFYLVGLHSYASGGHVITPMFVYYTCFGVVVLGAISYWRYRVNYSK